MEEITIDLKPREVVGKSVKRLRQEGLVPAVIHDHGKASVIVMGTYTDLLKIYQRAGKHHPVSLKAGQKHYMALIKTVDFDPKKHQLRHIVFNAVKANQKVTAEIPVHVIYDEGNEVSPAERAGLVVLNQLEVVEVEAFPRDLPEALQYNGEKLVEVGDQVTVENLVIPNGVTVKTDPAHPLATVFEPSALQAANDAVGGTDDEVVETEHPEGETIADVEETGEEAGASESKAEQKEQKNQ